MRIHSIWGYKEGVKEYQKWRSIQRIMKEVMIMKEDEKWSRRIWKKNFWKYRS